MAREFAYQVVYRYLAALIDDAERGGQPRLPSLRTLSRRLRVSLATVQAAYTLLEREGRVRSIAKSGYFAKVAVAPIRADVGHTPVAQPALERALLAQERRLGRSPARIGAAHAGAQLREALAQRYTHNAPQVWRPDDVQLGPDVQAVLETLLAALAPPGSTVLVATPCCWRILRTLQRCAVRVVELPLAPDGSAEVTTLARLLVAEPIALVILPSCLSAPLGRLMARRVHQQIADVLALHAVWLLENDLDSELCFTAPAASRLRDWVDPRSLLVLGSMEAAVGTEAPYAYLLGRAPAVHQAFALRDFQISPLRQQALARLLVAGDIDAQLRLTRLALQQRMEQLCLHLRGALGQQVEYQRPEGGHTLWLRLAQAWSSAAVLAATADSALHAVAGEQYGLPGRYERYVSLRWVGESPQALVQALQKLNGDATRR
ncbi:aminotransferase class I/II-fold pyridoxal phosphate-dependent enzyme [Pseudomonas sp.]|uniref:aminotransferase class I/II-fold pyridoxal phosphate-dependent enzyme n=1 Tax=Pseudomonas sp. TaxID=306 RepID=UPI0028B16E06|nr:aminotransferase class I/II-fold pyridoxal phosphate-dependent enzyme [Pseudomonas sp.]